LFYSSEAFGRNLSEFLFINGKNILILSYEVAQNIRQDSYGLVFGLNTFAALLFQTCLTMVVADDIGFALSPRHQVIKSIY